jgi:hypothetical protein
MTCNRCGYKGLEWKNTQFGYRLAYSSGELLGKIHACPSEINKGEDMDKMTGMDIFEKLNKAQDLLSDVYNYAEENGDTTLERLMSAADTMIVEAIDHVL